MNELNSHPPHCNLITNILPPCAYLSLYLDGKLHLQLRWSSNENVAINISLLLLVGSVFLTQGHGRNAWEVVTPKDFKTSYLLPHYPLPSLFV